MEYLDGCSTAIRHVVKKMAAMEGRLVCFTLQGCNFWMGRLAYDNIRIKMRNVSVEEQVQ